MKYSIEALKITDNNEKFFATNFKPAYNKKLLTSINLNNTLEHICFLSKSEWMIISILLRKSRLINSEHDIANAYFDLSNGYLAYLSKYCRETVRLTKESLQARGIILLDGKKWSSDKGKPKDVQRITFSPDFVKWIKKCVSEKRIQDARLFGHCDEYLIKLAERQARSFLAKIAYKGRQVLINTVENFSEVAKELVPPPTNSFGTSTKIENQNNEYQFSNFEIRYGEHQSLKSKLANALLCSLPTADVDDYKPISNSTIKFCSDLLKSGMTKIEVARQMIKIGYIKTIDDFEKRVFPKTIVQGS